MSKRANADDMTRFFDHDLYLPTRTIYMGSANYEDYMESGTDGAMAERIVKALHILDTQAPQGDKPIQIIMNNIGGDEYHGFAIYDAILACVNHVTIVVYGHAMSMGSIILQAADHRVMSPNSRQMIHYGTWGIHDHAKTAQKWAKEGEKIDQWMERMYMDKITKKHKKFKLVKLQKMLDHDTFFTAAESVKLGLCDEVLQLPVSDTKKKSEEADDSEK